MGSPSVDDVAGPALRSFVLRKAKEESDVQLSRARQLRGAPAETSTPEANAAGLRGARHQTEG